MNFFIKPLLIIFILSSFTYSQESRRRQKFEELTRINHQLKIKRKLSREIIKEQLNLLEEIRSASENDEAEAKEIGAKAIRLFPCCALEKLTESIKETWDSYTIDEIENELRESGSHSTDYRFSSYLLSDATKYSASGNSLEFTAKLQYKNNWLSILKEDGGNHGFLINIGRVPLENINLQTKEIVALAKYNPPIAVKWVELTVIKDEYLSDGFNFQLHGPAKVGDTFILRAVSYQELDANLDEIFALKINRKDADGSIIIFIKPIQAFDPPKLVDPQRERFFQIRKLGLKTIIQSNLKKNGFDNVEVEMIDTAITLKGTVPIGKSTEAIKIAEDVYRGEQSMNITLKSELIEK